MFTSAPVLSYPSPTGNGWVLVCDASNVGIGAVLHQPVKVIFQTATAQDVFKLVLIVVMTAVTTPLLLLAYRSSVHETLGVSPARMIFGRDLTLPIDLAMGRPVREEKHCVTDYAYELEQRLLDIHEYARKHLKIASDSMKRQYDVKTNHINYNIGDAVWYFKPSRRKGFNP